MSQRGLIISPPIAIEGNSVTLRHASIDPQELRYALLFWDVLNFPTNNVMRIRSSPDVQFLEGAGVLQRSEIRVDLVGEFGDLLRQAHVGAFKILDTISPGFWTVASGENSINFLGEDLEEGRGALFRLHRALPVPDTEVPLQDILEFRAKRKPELLAVRAYLEAAYQRILKAGDGDLSWNSEIDALDRSIVDLMSVARRVPFRWRWASLTANLNLPHGAFVTAAGVVAGLPLSQAAALGGASALSVQGGPSLRQSERTESPFRYILGYHADVFQ